MMVVLPVKEMRGLENAAISGALTSSRDLMEEAIRNSFEALQNDPEYAVILKKSLPVVVYTGKGNNAGDALGLARKMDACRVILRCATPVEEMSTEARDQLSLIPRDVLTIAKEPLMEIPGGCLIIDGLLGSGAHGALSPVYGKLVEEINTFRSLSPRSRTLSIDVPTGLDPDSGEPSSPTVRADVTLAIGSVKQGMIADGADDFVGRLVCVDLPSLPIGVSDSNLQVTDRRIMRLIPERPYSFYKNRAGRVQIIAGSPGFVGAAQMCAEAALHAGAGLVELYCQQNLYAILAARVAPEIMVHAVDSYRDIDVQKADALLVGPGLGTPSTQQLLALRETIHRASCPVLLDADALNLAAVGKLDIPEGAVITPHPGEMRRLMPQSVSSPRLAAALEFLRDHNCTLLLKGARSIIASRRLVRFNTSGGPYMATGGQGDVLSGVICAFLAQGVPTDDAAAAGAYLCGLAATRAYTAQDFPRSVSASSLFPYLGCKE